MLNERRHDVDSLRAIALFLLIAYHLAVSFMSWAPLVFFIPNNRSIDLLWVPMSMINTWRIPILFLISGIAFRFSFQKRSLKEVTQNLIEGQIDMIIEIDQLYQMVTDSKSTSNPTKGVGLLNTLFGWTLGGTLQNKDEMFILISV